MDKTSQTVDTKAHLDAYKQEVFRLLENQAQMSAFFLMILNSEIKLLGTIKGLLEERLRTGGSGNAQG